MPFVASSCTPCRVRGQFVHSMLSLPRVSWVLVLAVLSASTSHTSVPGVVGTDVGRPLPRVLRLRGGDVLVNPAHERRLARRDLRQRERNRGRILTPEERKKQSHRPERTLLVRNLGETVDETRLLNVFSLGGDVVKVVMPEDPETLRHHGYAFIEFRRPVDAASALCLCNFVKLSGRPMKIAHLIKSPEADEFYHPGAKLFVSRLAPEVTEWDLWWAFQTFGVILECHIPMNPTTEESKGIAFIRFADFESCEKALHLMEGQVIAGREISVRYSHDCILPDHLKGTPWQAKRRLSAQVQDFSKAAEAHAKVPGWVQQVRSQLPEDERRLQENQDRKEGCRRERGAAVFVSLPPHPYPPPSTHPHRSRLPTSTPPAPPPPCANDARGRTSVI
jgi:hypothetical protein